MFLFPDDFMNEMSLLKHVDTQTTPASAENPYEQQLTVANDFLIWEKKKSMSTVNCLVTQSYPGFRTAWGGVNDNRSFTFLGELSLTQFLTN